MNTREEVWLRAVEIFAHCKDKYTLADADLAEFDKRFPKSQNDIIDPNDCASCGRMDHDPACRACLLHSDWQPKEGA